MIQKLHSSDIELLMQLFVPQKYELHVFDPNGKLVFDKDFDFDQGAPIPKVLINLAPKVICYKQYSLEDFDFVFDFGQSKLPENFESKQFHFINNSNKTMRWLFPKQLEKPSFLNFFNSSSIKARLLKGLVKMGFNSPLKNVLKSGSFTLYHKAPLKLEVALEGLKHDNYSIFTGTVGPNRKAVVELNSNGETTHFAKIILNRSSLQLLKNEKNTLFRLDNVDFNYLKVPKVIPTTEIAMGVFTNIKPKKVVQTNQIEETHINALAELYSFSMQRESIKWTSFYEKTLTSLGSIKIENNLKETASIINSLKEIKTSLNTNELIPVAIGHADFTPWNTYVSKGKLHTYDWELSQREMPLLFDIFHYAFQSGVLVIHQSYKEIKKEIDRVISLPKTQVIIKQYGVNVDLHYKLYLLSNIAYYLNIYEKQEVLHEQAEWLVSVWNEALLDALPLPANETGRQFFMNEVMTKLSNKPHAVLKFHEESLSQVKESSDLDIVVLKKDLKEIIQFTNDHRSVERTKAYKKSFMTTIEIFFKDHTFLSLDLIHEFKRKSLVMLDAEKVIKSNELNSNDILVPHERFDLEYTCLFYLLNESSVPHKYQNYFNSFSISQKERMTNAIVNTYHLKAQTIDQLFEFNSDNRTRVLEKLTSNQSNRGFNKLKNQWNYIKDTLVDLKMRRGFTITFSGVDGAGKSTTIETIANKISQQFRRKVVVIRHRPSILPILSVYKYGKDGAEQRAVNSLPRTGNNTSVISSTLRFAYYFTDYLFGQFYVYAKHILRGEIVLYDRYYFDFINDAKRSNIIMPKQIVKMLYALILKPRINVFLYASPEVILKRKRELDVEAIETLTSDYRSLFSDYSKKFKHSKYLQIENINLDETVTTIMEEFSEAA